MNQEEIVKSLLFHKSNKLNNLLISNISNPFNLAESFNTNIMKQLEGLDDEEEKLL